MKNSITLKKLIARTIKENKKLLYYKHSKLMNQYLYFFNYVYDYLKNGSVNESFMLFISYYETYFKDLNILKQFLIDEFNVKQLFIKFLDENFVLKQFIVDYNDTEARLNNIENLYPWDYLYKSLILNKSHFDYSTLNKLNIKWKRILLKKIFNI